MTQPAHRQVGESRQFGRSIVFVVSTMCGQQVGLYAGRTGTSAKAKVYGCFALAGRLKKEATGLESWTTELMPSHAHQQVSQVYMAAETAQRLHLSLMPPEETINVIYYYPGKPAGSCSWEQASLLVLPKLTCFWQRDITVLISPC